MNLAILMGRLTRDPELKYTSNGKAYTTFTLAVQKTKDEAEFVDSKNSGNSQNSNRNRYDSNEDESFPF